MGLSAREGCVSNKGGASSWLRCWHAMAQADHIGWLIFAFETAWEDVYESANALELQESEAFPEHAPRTRGP